jgi:hypothetical protein
MNNCLAIQVAADGRPPGAGGPSDLASVEAEGEPSRKRQERTFSGIWGQSQSGARFKRKRLMRMTHQIANGD